MIRNRRSMGENPYRGEKKNERNSSNYDELKAWKEKKIKRNKTIRRIIFGSVLTIISFVLIVLRFIK